MRFEEDPMSEDASARLALEYIAPGQAQKELSHNEALARLDFLVQPAVVAIGIDAPPAAPEPGQCWIVGAAPTGAWADSPAALACWTSGGWRFASPIEGMAAWSVADGQPARFTNGAWAIGALHGRSLAIDGAIVVGAQQPAIADPAGGAIVDTAARGAIAAILAALRGHGLVAR
jgi:hypothetical protein